MSDSESSSEDDVLAAMAALPPDMLSEPQRAAIILQARALMDSSGTAGGGRGCVRSWTAGGGRGAAPVLLGGSRCMLSCRRAWPSTWGPTPLFHLPDCPTLLLPTPPTGLGERGAHQARQL